VNCPACERRAAQEQKAGAECKQEVKRLRSHSQRLSILVAILATLIGQEAFERAVAIMGAVDTFAAVEEEPEQYATTQATQAGDEEHDTQNKDIRHSELLLAYVPPLLPTLGREPPMYDFGIDHWDYSEGLMLPSMGSGTAVAAGLLLIPNRKRK
tara:strand:+ start:765 stop:1229 length:465 start_codon:yes stop_codon:yes gene_type:complete